jgi:hypothetical protein
MKKATSSTSQFAGVPRVRTGFFGGFLLILLLFRSATLSAQSPIRINFQSDEIGRIPSAWLYWNEKSTAKVYSVQAEGEKRFLHAEARGTMYQLGYEHRWDLQEFPWLQWQWRAVLFPVGTDEREKSKNDSVLGLYVVFGHWPFIKTIKYIWSDTLPVGTSFTSPYSSTTRILVVRSGRARQGTWVTERRNVLSDYRQFYGEVDKAPIASGIAVLTDSDDTHSMAIGDYADIRTSAREDSRALVP